MNNQQFRKFYDNEYGLVYYWLLSKLRNKVAAQDVTSQAFLKAWSKRKTLREMPKAHAWIMAIAHHEMVNHWRENNHRRHEPIESAFDVQDPRDFMVNLEHWYEWQRAANAATLLDSISRRAIAKAIQGISQQGTAGSRLFKARKELMELCAA